MPKSNRIIGIVVDVFRTLKPLVLVTRVSDYEDGGSSNWYDNVTLSSMQRCQRAQVRLMQIDISGEDPATWKRRLS